jgi:hypothetical protein
MKKGLILCLALVLTVGVAFAFNSRVLPVARELDGQSGLVQPVKQTASKNVADSVVGNVHINSCYIPGVLPLDMDPTTGDAFFIYRSSTNGNVYYVGTSDQGANYSIQGPLAANTIRYPSGMADVVNNKPYIFTNRGIVDPLSGAVTIVDQGGYSAGLWDPEVWIDTLGRASSGALAYYCVVGAMGTNGVIHAVCPYWGGSTPDAVFYYRSTDGGTTWNVPDPRSTNLFFYDLPGTSDSLVIFGANPVVHDSLYNEGGKSYVDQPRIWCSATGDTVLLASSGVKTLADSTTHGSLRWNYFYKISYDAGVSWSPFTWVDIDPDTLWSWGFNGAGAAFLDKNGYPHFVDGYYRDSLPKFTAAGETLYTAGPLSGLWDLHLTAAGWKMTQVSSCIDTLTDGTYDVPYFCEAGIGPDGEIGVAFASGYFSSASSNNGNSYMDIYVSGTLNNGASYSTPVKLTDGTEQCAFPHISRHLRGAGTKFPVYYQVGTRGNIHWVDYDSVFTGVEGQPSDVVSAFKLNQSRPNPVNKLAELSFTLPRSGSYSLKIYNIAGQVVRTLDGRGNAGQNKVTWNGLDNNSRKVANGVYLYNLNAFGNSATKKLVVVR